MHFRIILVAIFAMVCTGLATNTFAQVPQPQIGLADIDANTGVVVHPFPEDTVNHDYCCIGGDVHWVGDVNGDGEADFVVSYDPDAYLIFGGQDFSAGVDVTQLDGNKIVHLVTQIGAYGGVYPIGDFNGDGLDDFVLTDSNSSDLQLDIVFGRMGTWPDTVDMSALDGTDGTVITGGDLDLGKRLSDAAPLGDFNSDGYDDFLVGVPYRATATETIVGGAFVVFGGPGPWPATQDINTIANMSMIGEGAANFAGQRVATGDVNGDGHTDLLVSSAQADGNHGRIYVIYGSGAASWPSEVALANPTPLTGSIITTTSKFFIGFYLSSGFDFNGDGKDDILSGTIATDGNITVPDTVFVIPGQAFGGTYDVDAHQSDLFLVNGTGYGSANSSAGDVNGDGLGDIMFWRVNPDGADETWAGGEFDVIFGRANMAATFDLASLDGSNGFAVAASPIPPPHPDYGPIFIYDSVVSLDGSLGRDINHDGKDDLLFGQYFLLSKFYGTPGGAWVLYGPDDAQPQSATLVASVLPSARSGHVGGPDITVLMSVINAGSSPAGHCSISAPAGAPVSIAYAQTDPATNIPMTGSNNDEFGLAGGQTRSFVLSLTPQTVSSGEEVFPQVVCDEGSVAPIPGVNGVFVTIENAPGPDILSISATNAGGGIVDIPGVSGTGFMTVSAINIGAGDGSTADASEATLTVSVDSGSATLPLTLSICETDAASNCLAAPSGSVQAAIGNDASFFAVFATGEGTAIPLDPANSRINVRFTSASDVTHSVTSAAVRTVNP